MNWLEQYDPRIALLAALVGVSIALINSRFISRVNEEQGPRRLLWMSMLGLLAGVTVWAVQTLVVLGFRWTDPADGSPMAFGYDPSSVIFSLGVSAAIMSVAFRLDPSGRPEAWRALVRGGTLGLTAVGVNIAVLLSLDVQGQVILDPLLVGANLVLAPMLFGLAALFNAGPMRWRHPRLGRSILGLAIPGAIAIAIASVSLAPDPDVELPKGLMQPAPLGFLVMAVCAIVTAATFAFAMIGDSLKQEAENRYQHLALHDPLTGLPNRAFLMTALEDALTGARDGASPGLAVIGVDLDRFKPVNDVHGHAAGDALLCGIARAAEPLLEPGELFARTGGDEFIALKPGATEEEALDFARRLARATSAPVEFQGSALSVGASFGVALFPRDGQEAETLLSRMDLALYRAKEEAGDAIRLYDRRMDEAQRDRSALAMELRAALDSDAFELHYQPQTLLSDGAVTGYEALIRWRHPTRGLLGPDAFIGVAERTGLIRDIGTWVLHAACREAAGWDPSLRIAVNVSPRQLSQSDFVEQVGDALIASGLAPERLEIELTEASMIEDHAQLRAVMAALKTLGVRVAMDDYGAGYASLAALRNFPFDKIKIDREFIETLGSDPQSTAIVRSTLMLGRALGIPVLAEGVTTEAGRRILEAEGCREGQGFLFGRPVPAAELAGRAAIDADRPGPVSGPIAAPVAERGSIAAPGTDPGPDAAARPAAAPDSAELTSAPSGSGRGGAARNSA
ncbi:diguanylate cyclase (GGDEF) domain-containing protein [Albimonas donghaensis]|uniref:Diguanylate cyclase (GGDEF) domain-containing protein n=1 Tax=Albimonas donghaensis TaxID=356660 RepID=A0A1H2T865_9RHOB|nr:EAL domain-containing protein [Albimonas donghaensis]SDW40028.1 diguanylate cyclase (GGDEF) domain-containing protein [Albimonas donghaensis]